MDYCAPRGIPHSQFLGGPPVWTADDRDKALWWLIRDRERCPQCGTRADEWDPEQGGHDHAYRHELRKCWGCDEKAKGEKAIETKKLTATWVALTRNPEAVS